MGATVRFVKVIYDRQTLKSKRYAYAHFFGPERAQEFFEPRFPLITWKEPENLSHGEYYSTLKIQIDYSTEPPEVKQNLGNGGDDDKGQMPNQILLLQGLDKQTTLQDIHTSFQMICESIPIQNIMLVMDRATKTSCGYAFVHFSSVAVRFFTVFLLAASKLLMCLQLF
jgi:RNA recognition motif-containing protein